MFCCFLHCEQVFFLVVFFSLFCFCFVSRKGEDEEDIFLVMFFQQQYCNSYISPLSSTVFFHLYRDVLSFPLWFISIIITCSHLLHLCIFYDCNIRGKKQSIWQFEDVKAFSPFFCFLSPIKHHFLLYFSHKIDNFSLIPSGLFRRIIEEEK